MKQLNPTEVALSTILQDLAAPGVWPSETTARLVAIIKPASESELANALLDFISKRITASMDVLRLERDATAALVDFRKSGDELH